MVVRFSFILLLVEIFTMERYTQYTVLSQLSALKTKLQNQRAVANDNISTARNNEYHYQCGIMNGIDEAIDTVTAQLEYVSS